MRDRLFFHVIALAWGLTALAACKAEPADGEFGCARESDCPSGFVCRPDAIDAVLRCFRSGGGAAPDGGQEMPKADAGSVIRREHNDAGITPPRDAGGPAPNDGGVAVVVVRPAVTFGTLGERRSAGPFTLDGDGFEVGERVCSADARFCIQGGLTP